MKQPLDELNELGKMRQRFREAEEAEHNNREEAEKAIRFYFGDQWLPDIEQQRKADGRPCFTLNKLPSIVKQVLNETRQNKPAIQIDPVSDGADEDTAEAIQGLARHVENNSDAEIAYETAFVYLVLGGFGSWRVRHDYLPMSFDQDLFIEPILNPFSVYWDPHATKPDKSDARYCFITQDFHKDVFMERWPDSELSGLNDFSGSGDRAPGWMTSDGCRVVEYFEAETETSDLVQLQDGRAVWEDEMEPGDRIAVGRDGKPSSRPAERRRVYSSKSNGLEWLEKREELPTDDIPVVTIYGEQTLVDGEMRVRGMVHALIEPLRMFNYNASAIAETMALGSKANWIAEIDQIEEFQEIWRQSNNRNIAVLPYRGKSNAPPPQKIATEPPIQAMSAARLQSDDDLRSISGVYDATRSPNGGEESGKAILARRHQASTGNVNFTNSLARGIKRTARILLKYFPVIYDTARVMRITGSDMQSKQVMVHAGQPDSLPPLMPPGVKDVFDISVGTYDVTVSVGPSFESKRQEAVEMLLTLLQANPAMAPIIGDLIVNEMDFAGKSAIVERLQKALPPALQDQSNPTDPAQLQAHNLQVMQQNQALMQQVQKLTQMMQTDTIKSASREKVEMIKAQSAQFVADARLKQERLKAQADILTKAAAHSVNIVHDHAMADRSEAHDHAMASQGQVHALMNAPALPDGVTQ